MALCKDDISCQQRVEEHKSTQFDCQEVVNILRSNPLATFNIIPMDDSVANAIAALMAKCDMTAEEKSRVKVGFCDEKSAAVPDPFKHQGTEHELDAYDETHGTIDSVTNRIAEKLIDYEIQNPEGTFCPKRDLSSSTLKAIYDENGNAKFVDQNSDEFYKSILYSSDINKYEV